MKEINDYILVVDDTIENLKVLGAILKINDYNVAVVRSAAEAFEIIKQDKPLLILLDVMMPNMDGYEMCTQLKNTPEYIDIPIIFITAKHDSDDILHGFKVGGVDFITKPFNSAELLARVKVHVELQKARRLIEHQSQELKNLNAAKDRIFSIISHDVRTPISSLLQFIYLYEEMEEHNSSFFIRTIKEVESSANETLAMLDNLLHWSKSQMQNTQPNIRNCELDSIFEQTLALFTLVINKKQVTIEAPPEKLPPVMADKDMLKIVFRNVLSNAIKFTNTNSRIKIKNETKNGMCVISIADEGSGISDEILYKAFSDNEFHTQPGSAGEVGTGLGIKICKLFVQLNNGELGAFNNPDKGCTFWFSVPIAE